MPNGTTFVPGTSHMCRKSTWKINKPRLVEMPYCHVTIFQIGGQKWEKSFGVKECYYSLWQEEKVSGNKTVCLDWSYCHTGKKCVSIRMWFIWSVITMHFRILKTNKGKMWLYWLLVVIGIADMHDVMVSLADFVNDYFNSYKVLIFFWLIRVEVIYTSRIVQHFTAWRKRDIGW